MCSVTEATVVLWFIRVFFRMRSGGGERIKPCSRIYGKQVWQTSCVIIGSVFGNERR